jgi:type IV pilus biogenesis protein PilP
MRTDMKLRARAAFVVAALSWAGCAAAADAQPAAASARGAAPATAAPSAGNAALDAGKPAASSRTADIAPPAAWSSDAAAQLTRLEEQTVLLKAEIRKLDAQAEVAQRTAALARLGSAATIDPVSQNVHVVAIEGLGHRYTAVVQTGDGQRFDVAAGDELPNGMKIVSVGANDVVGRWSNGQTSRMVPMLAARSGAVFNAGTGAGAGLNAGAPGGTLVPAVDHAQAAAGLPPVYQPAP